MLQEHDCRYANNCQIQREEEDGQFECISENCTANVSLDYENENVDDDRVNVKENVLFRDTTYAI